MLCRYRFVALLILSALICMPLLAQDKQGEPKPAKKIDRLDLLEIRDLMHQMDTMKMQIAMAEKRIKELETETQTRFKALTEKYSLSKEDTVSMETGEIVPKKKEGANEK